MLGPLMPNRNAAMTSRARPATRERPVASENSAVDTAIRRRRPAGAPGGTAGTAGSVAAGSRTLRSLVRGPAPAARAMLSSGLGAARRAGGCMAGALPEDFVANIKQQKKRVHIAARQRLENLRYRSTIKT